MGHGYAADARGFVTFVRIEESETAWWEYKGSGIKAKTLSKQDMQDWAKVKPCVFPDLAVGEEAPSILAVPVMYRTEEGNLLSYDGKKVLYWSDTGAPTGITGLDALKQGHQPEEIMSALHDAAIKEGLTIECVGICDERRKFFVNARMDAELIEIAGHSKMAPIVTFASGVDMKTSSKADVNAWNVVCANLYAAFMAKGDTEHAYKRSHRQEFSKEDAFALLNIADFDVQWKETERRLLEYAETKINTLQAQRMYRELINPGYASEVIVGEGMEGPLDVESIVVPKDADHMAYFEELLQSPTKLNAETRIELDRHAPRGFIPYMEAYHGENGEAGAKPGDVYGFLQGVTYVADHGGHGTKASGRKVASGWFGNGAKRKVEAYDLADSAVSALG